MASILLNLPPDLHRRLKLRATAGGRSLRQEALLAIEWGLGPLAGLRRNNLPPPVPARMKVPLTQVFLDEVRRERDARG
ncbi:MAG TPA: TraY domain-containing protein [Opitutaceae bacterium]|jgi:hypothetical protein|nr:TraY domain-containing protein [Opitutaceae bacterium]